MLRYSEASCRPARSFGVPQDDRRVEVFHWSWVRLSRVRETLEREIAGRPDLSHLGKHVEIALTPSGLDIELIEATQSLFFQSGSA